MAAGGEKEESVGWDWNVAKKSGQVGPGWVTTGAAAAAAPARSDRPGLAGRAQPGEMLSHSATQPDSKATLLCLTPLTHS